jgi:hypothetical protein
MFPDHPGSSRTLPAELRIYSVVPGRTPVVPESTRTSTGALPGFCRDVSETVA